MGTHCAGKGYDCCDSCINQEIDYECDDCDDGDRWEGDPDADDELSIHDLKKVIFMKEAA